MPEKSETIEIAGKEYTLNPDLTTPLVLSKIKHDEIEYVLGFFNVQVDPETFSKSYFVWINREGKPLTNAEEKPFWPLVVGATYNKMPILLSTDSPTNSLLPSGLSIEQQDAISDLADQLSVNLILTGLAEHCDYVAAASEQESNLDEASKYKHWANILKTACSNLKDIP